MRNLRELDAGLAGLERLLGSDGIRRLLTLADALERASPADIDELARALVVLERPPQRRFGRPRPAVSRGRRAGSVGYG
jgi:hypothetical protein